jgi:competence ComEA-like helix-hairpin-helix protein
MKQSPAIARNLTLLLATFIAFNSLTGCARVTLSHRPDDPAASQSALPKLNLNTASAAELETLPGVGRVLAERIVTHRIEHGPFRKPEHLLMVRGISDEKFRALQSLVSVE